MTPANGLVWVLDDDRRFLVGLRRLLAGRGYQVRVSSDADELLNGEPPQVPACLLLDLHLGNGGCGMWVHEKMRRDGWEIPTLFLASTWTVQTIVDTMRAGAEGFIPKPCQPAEVLDAVARAMSRACELHRRKILVAEAIERAATLTTRERNVVGLIVSGLLNKEIADQLGIAVATVKVHRARAMDKLQAGNPADLARIAGLAGLVSSRQPCSLPGWQPEFGNSLLAG